MKARKMTKQGRQKQVNLRHTRRNGPTKAAVISKKIKLFYSDQNVQNISKSYLQCILVLIMWFSCFDSHRGSHGGSQRLSRLHWTCEGCGWRPINSLNLVAPQSRWERWTSSVGCRVSVCQLVVLKRTDLDRVTISSQDGLSLFCRGNRLLSSTLKPVEFRKCFVHEPDGRLAGRHRRGSTNELGETRKNRPKKRNNSKINSSCKGPESNNLKFLEQVEVVCFGWLGLAKLSFQKIRTIALRIVEISWRPFELEKSFKGD